MTMIPILHILVTLVATRTCTMHLEQKTEDTPDVEQHQSRTRIIMHKCHLVETVVEQQAFSRQC